MITVSGELNGEGSARTGLFPDTMATVKKVRLSIVIWCCAGWVVVAYLKGVPKADGLDVGIRGTRIVGDRAST